MTVIAAYAYEGVVAFGADGMVSADDLRWPATYRKIMRIEAEDRSGDVLLAGAGSTDIFIRAADRWRVDTLPDPDDPDECDQWARCVGQMLEVLDA